MTTTTPTKQARPATYSVSALLSDHDTLTGYPDRPGTIRPTVRATRLG